MVEKSMIKCITVGVRSDGKIEVDFQNEELESCYHESLTLTEAKFLIDELEFAIQRQKRRKPKSTITGIVKA